MQVSINTIMEAYARLENKGMVEARPQSGYYVRMRPAIAPPLTVPVPARSPMETNVPTPELRFPGQ